MRKHTPRTFNIGDPKAAGLCAQFYAPYFQIERWGLNVHLPASFRVSWRSGYTYETAIAFKFLGFGFAVRWAEFKTE